MPTDGQDVTTTPTALTGLTQDTNYVGWVRGPFPVNVMAASSAPDPDTAEDYATVMPRYDDTARFKPTADDSIYVWAKGNGSRFVWDEEP